MVNTMTIKSLEAEYSASLDKFDASLSVSIKDKVAEYLTLNPDSSKTRANAAIRAEHSSLHEKVLVSMQKLVSAKKADVFFKRFKHSMHASFKSRKVRDKKLATVQKTVAKKPVTKKQAKRKQSKAKKS